MTKKLAIICFVLAMTSGVAVADVVDECHSVGSVSVGGERLWVSATKASLEACTEIIEKPGFGEDEKAVAYRYRGEMRMYAGAVQKATADFTESLRIKENAPAFADRGWVKFTQRDLAAAISDYSNAIRISPTLIALYIERGHIYLVNGELDEAIRDLTEAIRLNPKSASAFNTRGFAYAKKFDFVQAQKDYTTAINIEPHAIIYANRGYLFEVQDRRDEAVADLKHALRLDPSLIEAMSAMKRLGVSGAISSESARRTRLGKELAVKNCGSCHAVGMNDTSQKKGATAFRTLYRQYQNWSLRPPIERAIHSTHDSMPPRNFTDEDVNAIVAYIDSFVPQR
jgi:tetratricopeptide (TPR) repeat protein